MSDILNQIDPDMVAGALKLFFDIVVEYGPQFLFGGAGGAGAYVMMGTFAKFKNDPAEKIREASEYRKFVLRQAIGLPPKARKEFKKYFLGLVKTLRAHHYNPDVAPKDTVGPAIFALEKEYISADWKSQIENIPEADAALTRFMNALDKHLSTKGAATKNEVIESFWEMKFQWYRFFSLLFEDHLDPEWGNFITRLSFREQNSGGVPIDQMEYKT